MKKNTCFFILCLLISAISTAQFNNRIGVGLDYVALDLPDDLVFIPHLKYERILGSRVFLSSKVGYVNFKGVDGFFNKIPQTRNRITFDNGLKFAVIKYKNSYLKLGSGVSIWRRNDVIVNNVKITAVAPDFVTEITKYDTKIVRDWNFGYNFSAELDVSLNKRVSLVGNFSVANFKYAGLSSILGLSAFYKFK